MYIKYTHSVSINTALEASKRDQSIAVNSTAADLEHHRTSKRLDITEIVGLCNSIVMVMGGGGWLKPSARVREWENLL